MITVLGRTGWSFWGVLTRMVNHGAFVSIAVLQVSLIFTFLCELLRRRFEVG